MKKVKTGQMAEPAENVAEHESGGDTHLRWNPLNSPWENEK